MKRFLFFVFVVVFLSTHAEILFPGLTGSALADSVVKYYKSSSNLGYDAGRDTLYGVIDKIDGYLTCVYSAYSVYMVAGQDPSTYAYNNGINCEHTWPQSLGASGLGEGDLHHLYPTEIDVNAARGNLPFGEIADNSTNRWYYNNSYITSIPSSNIDWYSELLTGIRFEPREDHKGNAARSMFYFFTMYKSQYIALDSDTSFWKGQIDTLLAWHYREPVDARELWRTNKIGTYQQNKPNPFIIDTTLARRIYFPWMHLQEEFALEETKQRESLAVYDMGEKKIFLKIKSDIAFTHFSVSDINGRIVMCGKPSSDIIDLDKVSRGIYFVKILQNKQIVFSSKIIII
ncbi:MAG: endonuclease [bacterium]|nr:endonuclease [bacterium]